MERFRCSDHAVKGKNMLRKSLCLCFLLLVGGCNWLAWPLYVISPPAPMKDVPAECTADLSNKTVAFVVYVDQKVKHEYPIVQEYIGRAMAAEFQNDQIRKQIKGLNVVDVLRVLSFQQERIDWDEMPRTELAKALGADYLIFITLQEFTTREHGSVNLYRGMVTGTVTVHDAEAPERTSAVYNSSDIRVIYPEKRPEGLLGEDNRIVLHKTVLQFAHMVAKKFYNHKVPA